MPMQTTSSKQAAILGGGIAGLAAAIRFKKSGWTSHIFERSAARERVGHGFILLENGLQSLKALGLGEPISASGHAITEFNLFDSEGKLIHQAPIQSAKGFRRMDFLRILEESLPAQTLVYEKKFTHFTYDPTDAKSTAHFEDGSSSNADLFLASDGINSAIRKQLFPESQLTEVRVKELVSHIHNPALADWLGSRFVKFQRSQGGLALGMVPAGDGQLIWYIQFDAHKYPLTEQSEEAKSEFARAHFQGWPHPIPDLLRDTDFSLSHTWMTTDLDPLPELSSSNIALIGDAAHAFLPFTSQGVNAALTDALTLGELLDQYCIPEALHRYSCVRRPEIEQTVEAGRLLRERFLMPEAFANDPSTLIPLAK